ncbi:carbohydrate kinase, pfkB family [Legionella wadsworthii]|uniref:Carbohydrate kinase, pfkB family n=1 Tax=Legionella wadsworthii TaxID=28088 RepID=A0A378LX60_9GAMM|nr:carbohydrate kinase family protein [Legionella wadsworthii]STY30987.1 carbohydrate kinase, pfkB family [Legionella wadsworthii]
MNKIICIGGITVDRKITPSYSLHLATSNPVSSTYTFGGVAHNVAKNLSLLTSNVHLYSVVGPDNYGFKVKADLKKFGIHTQNIFTLPNKSTAQYDVILNQNGELFLALADMEIFDHVPADQFTQSWHEWNQNELVFLDTNLPQVIIEQALQKARTENMKLCIDPVSVAKARKLPPCLESIFLIKPDRLEAEALAQIPIRSLADCMKAGQLLLDKGVKNCVISLGKHGYVLINERIKKHVPAFDVDPILDVSGAGDAFIAGILFELQKGSSIENACQTGAAMAALTLQSTHTVHDKINLEAIKNIISKSELREPNHESIF